MELVAVMLFTQQVFRLECLLLFRYFGLNLSLVLFIKVFKKHLTVLLSSLKLEKELCHMVLFLCLFGISLGQYCRKSLAKSKGFRKNIKRKGWF